MKASRIMMLSLCGLMNATVVATGLAYGQSSRFNDLANAPFDQNRPTKQHRRR